MGFICSECNEMVKIACNIMGTHICKSCVDKDDHEYFDWEEAHDE